MLINPLFMCFISKEKNVLIHKDIQCITGNNTECTMNCSPRKVNVTADNSYYFPNQLRLIYP